MTERGTFELVRDMRESAENAERLPAMINAASLAVLLREAASSLARLDSVIAASRSILNNV